MSALVWGRFSCAAYRISNFASSSLMSKSVDVPVLFLATALTQMKMNTLNGVSRYILPDFIAQGKKKGGGEIEAT